MSNLHFPILFTKAAQNGTSQTKDWHCAKAQMCNISSTRACGAPTQKKQEIMEKGRRAQAQASWWLFAGPYTNYSCSNRRYTGHCFSSSSSITRTLDQRQTYIFFFNCLILKPSSPYRQAAHYGKYQFFLTRPACRHASDDVNMERHRH